MTDFSAFPAVAAAADPANAPADKAGWRAAADTVARNRPAPVRKQHAAALAQHIVALAQQIGAKTVALYSPVGAEPETRDLANTLIVHGYQLAYPRVAPDGSRMDMAVCAGPSALVARPRSRLLEPPGPACDPHVIDLAVVPTVAVSPDLVRLGRGGGHYDRYLPQLRADAVTVAAVAAGCVWQWAPQEPHDCRLHLACTERGLFRKA